MLSRHKNIKYCEDGKAKAVLTFTEKVFPTLNYKHDTLSKMPELPINRVKLAEFQTKKANRVNAFRLKKSNKEEDENFEDSDKEFDYKYTPSMDYKVENDELFKKDISDRLFMNPIMLSDYKNYTTKKSSHKDLKVGYIHKGKLAPRK